jgi:lipopolysaccharide export LptBFGC system permease protein LptF
MAIESPPPWDPPERRARIRGLTLQLYVLRQLAFSFAFSLGGISLLVFPSVIVQAVHRMQGVSPATIVRFLPLVLVDLVPYLLPMAFLLSVVATFGRMAAERETVAIKMAGFHPGKLLLPGLGMAALLSVGTYWVVAEVSPEWKFARNDFVKRAKERAFQALGHGVTEIELEKFYLKADSQDPEDPGTFYGVILSLPQEDGELTVFADRISLSFEASTMILAFEGFQVFRENYELFNQSPEWRLSLDELFPQEGRNPNRPKYMSSSRIRSELAHGTGEVDEKTRRKLLYELQPRPAASVTYVLFLLLGVPTGIFLRSGTQLAAFSGAVGYAFLYYLLAIRLGKELADAGAVPPVLAAWSTNALFLLIGLFLAHRALWR